MREPRRNHYIAPATGDDTRDALDAALERLAAGRDLDACDAATALHLLASLAAETQARLAPAIGLARHQGCSWAEIADLLGITRASAWQRWAHQHNPSTRTRPP
jgi:hypothetical protein